MTVARNLKTVISRLPAARQARIRRRGEALVAEELSLQELRKAMNLTQAELARTLGVGQHTVSRYEQRADLLLSTLQSYVGAMGGTLALVAEFPHRKAVRIRQLQDLGADQKSS